MRSKSHLAPPPSPHLSSFRASAAANGRPPPDFAAVTAAATDRTIRHLASKVKKMEDSAKDKPKERRDGNDGYEANYNGGNGSGRRRRGYRGRGGRGGRGGGGGGDDKPPPGKRPKMELCFKFNDKRGCTAAKAGKSALSPLILSLVTFLISGEACSNNGRSFTHRCSNKIDGVVCNGPHAAVDCKN